MKLKSYRMVFFDFDGVIKDSVSVKSDAFELLFSVFGRKISSRIRVHHEANGGMSRYDKIPLYLSWAGIPLKDSLVEEYSNRFSKLVKQKVIGSEWVAGVERFICDNCDKYQLFIVTATPQPEIEEILSELKILDCFSDVVGAPTKKIEAITMLVRKYQLNTENAVMIGDSMPDYLAADHNNIDFILRKTALNKGMQKTLQCKMINDFIKFKLDE